MILISTQCFLPVIGGLENLMSGLADNIAKEGHELIVFADGKHHKDDESYNFKIIRFNAWKPIRRIQKARAIKKYIKNNNVKCLFADSWKSIEHLNINDRLDIYALAHGSEILQVKKNLNFFYSIKKKIKLRRIKMSFKNSNMIIANSNYTKDLIINNISVESKKIKVIFPGITINSSKSEKNKYATSNINDQKPVLITLARLEERKGHTLVLDAIKKLQIDYPNILYLIAGEGPFKKTLQKKVESLGLEKNVKFLGWISEPDKSYYLKKSKIFIMTPHQVMESIEGFGMSYIDAAIHGVPVIASISGGIKDAVHEGVNGMLIPEGNVLLLEKKIRELLVNKILYDKISKNAIDYSEDFIWKNKIKEYLSIIK